MVFRGHAGRRAAVFLAALAAPFGGGAAAGPPQDWSGRIPHLFAADSPFFQPIAPDAAVDPNSDLMIGSLLASHDGDPLFITLTEWTVPVYFADADTPRHTVRLTAAWSPAAAMIDVPIPPRARPDPEDDAEMTIIDLDAGCAYDFWQARHDGDGWAASWANALPIPSDGVYPTGMSARGAGFALLAGLIWPAELRRGRIDHALVFSYDFPDAGGPVAPATESDGRSARSDAIPEGARVQLDPALDLEALGLSGPELVVARALQDYGMILGDNGGGIELEAVHPMSFPAGAYDGLLPAGEPWVYLPNIPVNRFRVLKLPPQIADPDNEVVANGCNHYR